LALPLNADLPRWPDRDPGPDDPGAARWGLANTDDRELPARGPARESETDDAGASVGAGPTTSAARTASYPIVPSGADSSAEGMERLPRAVEGTGGEATVEDTQVRRPAEAGKGETWRIPPDRKMVQTVRAARTRRAFGVMRACREASVPRERGEGHERHRPPPD
jgi:hypothetical protein